MEKGLIYSDQLSMFGNRDIIGYSNGNIYVKEVERDMANDIIKKNHYSHKVYNGTYIHLGVYINDKLYGILQYGYAMNPASGNSVVEGTSINQYLELNRMWIDDIGGKNTESMAISCSITYIKHKHPKIKWIQSFADERCGCFGIVYQACSFNYYGEHISDFYSLNGEYIHKIALTHLADNRKEYLRIRNQKEDLIKEQFRQFRYIFFLDKSWKKKCLLKEMPYPKYYNENK
jgi:adenine modification enzyme